MIWATATARSGLYSRTYGPAGDQNLQYYWTHARALTLSKKEKRLVRNLSFTEPHFPAIRTVFVRHVAGIALLLLLQ